MKDYVYEHGKYFQFLRTLIVRCLIFQGGIDENALSKYCFVHNAVTEQRFFSLLILQKVCDFKEKQHFVQLAYPGCPFFLCMQCSFFCSFEFCLRDLQLQSVVVRR